MPTTIEEIAEWFLAHGGHLFGGYVRDTYIRRQPPAHDLDILSAHHYTHPQLCQEALGLRLMAQEFARHRYVNPAGVIIDICPALAPADLSCNLLKLTAAGLARIHLHHPTLTVADLRTTIESAQLWPLHGLAALRADRFIKRGWTIISPPCPK